MDLQPPDPKIKIIRDKLREGLIKRIPQLLERLDKLPPDQYAKYWFSLSNIVEGRNPSPENNKHLQK